MTRIILYFNTLFIFAPVLHWALLWWLPSGDIAEIQAISVLFLLAALIPAAVLIRKPGSQIRSYSFLFAALLILCGALWLYLQMVSIRPMGMWDAWSQWNLKARDYSLSFLHGHDFVLSRPEWFNAQYPPAYPMQISFWTVLIGEWSQNTPIAVNAVLYTLPACMLLTIESGRTTRRKILGLTALISLFLIPQLWLNATNLCADTYLATGLMLSLYWAYRARTSRTFDPCRRSAAIPTSTWMLFYAFANAGFLLLIKPEGMILVPFAVASIVFMQGRRIFRSSPIIWAPLVLFVVLLFWFKAHAVERVQYEVIVGDVLQRLMTWDRYERLLRHFVALNLLSSGGVLFVFLGLAIRRHWMRTLIWSSPLFLALACYHGIFLITPIDQEMHLLQAYARISMHIYPALLFLLYLIIRGACKGGLIRLTP